MLAELLTSETIRVRIPAKDWEEVVEQAGQLLLATERIEPRYIDAMKEMVQNEGAYMVIAPGLALLHARPEEGALEECMSLVTLARPVVFGHPENDPVDVAFAFAASDKDLHIQVMAELARVLMRESRLARIRKASSVNQALEALGLKGVGPQD